MGWKKRGNGGLTLKFFELYFDLEQLIEHRLVERLQLRQRETLESLQFVLVILL